MSEKAENVLQKAWRTIAQDHFKRLQESLDPWKQNMKKLGMHFTLCLKHTEDAVCACAVMFTAILV